MADGAPATAVGPIPVLGSLPTVDVARRTGTVLTVPWAGFGFAVGALGFFEIVRTGSGFGSLAGTGAKFAPRAITLPVLLPDTMFPT